MHASMHGTATMRTVMTASALRAADAIVALTCHPTTPCNAVRAIRVEVCRAVATLELRYRTEGDIEDLIVPAVCAARRVDRLSQHTCFEAFIRAGDGRGYLELNFSPSTEWAVYSFTDYRTGMTDAGAAAPHISVQRDHGVLQLDVVIDLASLPQLPGDGQLKLALSAVIEEADHRLSYWALAHPAGKPDFHHAEGFALAVGGGDVY
jgi:hypothetical protein